MLDVLVSVVEALGTFVLVCLAVNMLGMMLALLEYEITWFVLLVAGPAVLAFFDGCF